MPASPLTVAQAAERLGVGVDVVAAHIRAGRLAASNVGLGSQRPRYRITPEAIEEFLAERLVRPAAPAARPRRRRLESVTEYF